MQKFRMPCKPITLNFYVLQTPAGIATRVYSTGKMVWVYMYDKIIAT